ncbi:MAG: pyridoxamine kinase [Lachnospiraceae bacterium]|nr:pyridoxamine kinase [Lachnospiraceae bacterium]
MVKRVLTIQDLSCIGKCSLTEVIPVLAAAGLEVAAVPTAVLSTHTQFSGVHIRDLTDDLAPIRQHFEREGFSFAGILTGYLGSIRQVDLVLDFIHSFGTGEAKVIVDPVMADQGKLYRGFDEDFVKKMRTLCGAADVILPNVSEAALLTDLPYPGENASEAELKSLLQGLRGLGAPLCVITGAHLDDGTIGFLGYDAEQDAYLCYGTQPVPFVSHGTGDLFAGTFTAGLLSDHSCEDALQIASKYTSACIQATYEDPDHVNYGVNFESRIPYLLQLLGQS